MKTLTRRADDEIKNILFEPTIACKINGDYKAFTIKTLYDEFFQLWKEPVVFREFYKECKDDITGKIFYKVPTLFAFMTVRRAGKCGDEKINEIKKESEFCKVIYHNFKENTVLDKDLILDNRIFNKEGSFNIDEIKNLNEYTFFHLKEKIQDKLLEGINSLISNEQIFNRKLDNTEKIKVLKICLRLDPRVVSLIINNFNNTHNPKIILDLSNNIELKPFEMTKESFEIYTFKLKTILYFIQYVGVDIMVLIRKDQEGIMDKFKYQDIDNFEVEYPAEVKENINMESKKNKQKKKNKNRDFADNFIDHIEFFEQALLIAFVASMGILTLFMIRMFFEDFMQQVVLKY